MANYTLGSVHVDFRGCASWYQTSVGRVRTTCTKPSAIVGARLPQPRNPVTHPAGIRTERTTLLKSLSDGTGRLRTMVRCLDTSFLRRASFLCLLFDRCSSIGCSCRQFSPEDKRIEDDVILDVLAPLTAIQADNFVSGQIYTIWAGQDAKWLPRIGCRLRRRQTSHGGLLDAVASAWCLTM